MSWLYYLVAIPVFAVIVLIHEFGHYITARWADIRVEEFGIGFPPRAFGIKSGETLYSINWLPIGGFVRMTGETGDGVTGGPETRGRVRDADAVDGSPGAGSPVPAGQADPRSFASKPAWKRIVVLLAGVTMNLLLAIVLLGAADVVGKVVDVKPYIGQITSGSPAQQAGLQPGDEILAINGQQVKTFTDLTKVLKAIGDGTPRNVQTVAVQVEIERASGGAPVTLAVNMIAHPTAGQGHLGFQSSDAHPIITKVPLWQLPQAGVKEVGTVISAIFGAFGQIATGQLSFGQAFMGPVGIVQTTGEVAATIPQSGWYFMLYLVGALSVSLAIINVLPVPALDGGRVLLVLIEIVRRGKKLAPEREGMINLAGMAVLLGFVMIVTFFDVSRIIGGH